VVILKLLDVVEQFEKLFLNRREFDTGDVNFQQFTQCV
jgi:hypothetical protein